jgi:hypothetical protein
VIDDLLSRLEKVKKTGAGTWLACCPAHSDKSPSLSVRELADTRILLHCFAGCGVDAILDAAGLTFDALFPEKCVGAAAVAAVRRPYPAADVLEALQAESLFVSTCACNLGQGIVLTPADKERLLLAHERISEARRLTLG